MYKTLVKIRSRLLVCLTHKLALPLLKLVRKPEVFPYHRNQLLAFPEGSLGRSLILMLEENDFQLLTHYAKHDMKHILLGYPTTDKGEVCLQAFMLGNGHISFPVLSTLAFGVLTMPEYWASFCHAYQRGRSAYPIHNWKWNVIVHEQTAVLKQLIFKINQ
jgi:ubiquinone biosynthesis protein Coq4